MGDLTMTVPGALLFGAFLLKVPALRRNPRDALLRCVCVLLLLASLVFLLAAVPVLAAVNRLTGIPNLAAPLVYSVLSALSGVCIVLVIIWRGGTTERTKRASFRCLAAYGVVIVALGVLFALGDAPVERLRDLDTYYAGTPYIREMIVLYLLAHTVAAGVTTILCWRWSLRVHGVLRVGLTLIVCGYLLNLGYDAAKFTAVGGRWTGHDLDWLSTHVARPLASASALLIGAGFVFPLVAQRIRIEWGAAVRHRRLGTLVRRLTSTAGRGAPGVAIGPWASMELRLTQREAAIHDGIIALRPYFDEELRSRVESTALDRGHSPAEARIIADAGMIAAAAQARETDPVRTVRPGGGESVRPSTEADDLVLISLALRRSPLVRPARRPAAMSESGGPWASP
ncbi:MAB_1171c family putative transporter [Streptomyces sp. NPDC051018]|uniref:MAB_1171c family putative transporter n=1 Tax=Streptomyces sp. NPDC051018 TaxID=3365639 RepID=UPI003799229D